MDQSKNQSKKKEFDRLRNIKFKGYCWAHTPPGDESSLSDLISFAKFFLCKRAGRLWKDPIWDQYTDEEILVEYFAHLFSDDKGAKEEFELDLNHEEGMVDEDAYAWLERKVAENQEEMKKKMEELPEKISFSPGKNEDKET